MKDKAAKQLDKAKNANIETVYKVTKWIQIVMAILIFIQATIRLFAEDSMHSWSGFLITTYMLVFAVMIMLIELNKMRARVWFYFLNFALGRFMFYVFMTLVCFGTGGSVMFMDVLVGIACAVCAIGFFFIHLWHKDNEEAHVKTLIESMGKGSNNAADP